MEKCMMNSKRHVFISVSQYRLESVHHMTWKRLENKAPSQEIIKLKQMCLIFPHANYILLKKHYKFIKRDVKIICARIWSAWVTWHGSYGGGWMLTFLWEYMKLKSSQNKQTIKERCVLLSSTVGDIITGMDLESMSSQQGIYLFGTFVFFEIFLQPHH